MTSFAPLKDILNEDIGTLRRPSLADAATEKLRELILLEKLPPLQPLNEREISEMLGISRSPVREAIRQLEVDGLVEYSETRRPFVADPSIELLADWLVVQGALEALAGELACAHASDEEIERITQLHTEMVDLAESDDRYLLFGIDMAFHSAIVAAAHNPSLAETHRTFNARLWRARFVSARRRANSTVQSRKHQEIVDALIARDPKRTAMALRQHLATAVDNITLAKAEWADDVR